MHAARQFYLWTTFQQSSDRSHSALSTDFPETGRAAAPAAVAMMPNYIRDQIEPGLLRPSRKGLDTSTSNKYVMNGIKKNN